MSLQRENDNIKSLTEAYKNMHVKKDVDVLNEDASGFGTGNVQPPMPPMGRPTPTGPTNTTRNMGRG